MAGGDRRAGQRSGGLTLDKQHALLRLAGTARPQADRSHPRPYAHQQHAVTLQQQRFGYFGIAHRNPGDRHRQLHLLVLALAYFQGARQLLQRVATAIRLGHRQRAGHYRRQHSQGTQRLSGLVDQHGLHPWLRGVGGKYCCRGTPEYRPGPRLSLPAPVAAAAGCPGAGPVSRTGIVGD